MFDEDGRKIDIQAFPAKMDGMSIEELEEYTVELKAEIERALQMIAKKKASQDAAASIFKS